jgi:F0F1-type ATP synthase membrane subunit c/vacuolar-type H+-ATPase subunit K
MGESGSDAGSKAHRDPVGRSRFRLSFTVAVLQLAVAVVGVGVALLVSQQGHGNHEGAQRTAHAGSLRARATDPVTDIRSAGHTSTLPASSNSPTFASSSDQAAPTGSDESTANSRGYGASWPAGFAGYTVALASDIIRSDAVGAVAKARAAGLPDAGMLRSDRYASLTPGYWFVFSGVYATVERAIHEVPAAAAGFSDAYVRRVAE